MESQEPDGQLCHRLSVSTCLRGWLAFNHQADQDRTASSAAEFRGLEGICAVQFSGQICDDACYI